MKPHIILYEKDNYMKYILNEKIHLNYMKKY